jgi:ABC-type lipoprotein release transport system permease subunit
VIRASLSGLPATTPQLFVVAGVLAAAALAATVLPARRASAIDPAIVLKD